MNIKKIVSGIFLFGLIATMIVAGMQYKTVFADGESFSPMSLSISATYNAAGKTVSLSGSETDGTESFTTFGGGPACPGFPTPQAWPVTGPLVGSPDNWSITNSGGVTVLSGLGSAHFSFTDNPAPTRTYVFPCASQTLSTTHTLITPIPVDVSSLAPGTYTINLSVNSPCAPSVGYVSCNPAPPVASDNSPFTIGPSGTVTGVSVTCAPASVLVNQSSFCVATVSGTGSYSSAVNWSANAGAINGSGVLTAPGVPATVTVTATSAQDPTKNGTFPVDVAALPPVIGTINVTSKNSANAALVPSSWNFAGSIADPCGGVPTLCSGTARVYTGQPAGNAAIDRYVINTPVNPTGFSLRSIKQNIAQKENPFIAFVKNLFVTAEASQVCGFVNAFPQTCPVGPLPLGATGDVANFVILWDPMAAMSITPSPVGITASPVTVSVANVGSSGSTLDWNTSAPSYTGTGGWLTLSQTSGTGIPSATSQPITFTANPAAPGLIPGNTYTATVNFLGTSQPGGQTLAVQPITISFTVPVAGPPPSPVSIVSVTPASSVKVTTPITATCSGGSGSYKWSITGAGTYASNTGSTFTVSYDTPSSPTYTITCTDASDPSNTASVPVTVTQVTPVCSFAANPKQIVLPGSSVLSWTCVNADGGCNINGTSVNPVTGTLSVSPLTNTTYVLTCAGPGSGPGSTSSISAQVRVVGPGVIEGNP